MSYWKKIVLLFSCDPYDINDYKLTFTQNKKQHQHVSLTNYPNAVRLFHKIRPVIKEQFTFKREYAHVENWIKIE